MGIFRIDEILQMAMQAEESGTRRQDHSRCLCLLPVTDSHRRRHEPLDLDPAGPIHNHAVRTQRGFPS